MIYKLVDHRILFASTLVVLAIGWGTAGLHPRPEFYETVAQILPVFIVIAVVEARFFRQRPSYDAFDRFALRSFWLSTLVGLAAALVVIAEGHDTLILRGLVLTSLIVITVVVSFFATDGPLFDEGSE